MLQWIWGSRNPNPNFNLKFNPKLSRNTNPIPNPTHTDPMIIFSRTLPLLTRLVSEALLTSAESPEVLAGLGRLAGKVL